MSNLPVFQGSWRSLGTQLQPERFASMLASHPARTRLRWFRAMPEPSYDFEAGAFDQAAGSGVYREEVVEAREHWAVVDTADRFAKQMGMVGQIPVGKLMCLTMNDQIPLAEGDEVVVLGQSITRGVPDGAKRPFQRTLVRGNTIEVRQGTISITGREVVGVGTKFLADTTAGTTILRCLGMTAPVASVQDDTHLTLGATFPQDVTGQAWERMEDVLPEWPAVRLQALRSRLGNLPLSAVKISEYGDRLEWLDPSVTPVAGERFSIRYDYLPRYLVREVGGYSVPPSVQGHGMIQMVMLDTVVGSAPS